MKDRVLFIDLVRAYAVIVMVQGHTIDLFMLPQYRTDDYPIFAFWNFNRGLTAPLFLFGAGMIFNYLFKIQGVPFRKNPRVWKGIKRFFLLFLLAYGMKYPEPHIYPLTEVQDWQWKIFYTADVLHLIAFGLLFTIGINWISEKLKMSDRMLFVAASAVFIAVFPFTNQFDWNSIFPVPVANFFYTRNGSNFPFFPWLAYLWLGAASGSYLAQNVDVIQSRGFPERLVMIGLSLSAFALVCDMMEPALFGQSTFWTTSPNLIILRIGLVVLINAAFGAVARRMRSRPRIILLLGRHSLLIYVAHIIILYGCPWMLGLEHFWRGQFSVWLSLFAAVEMMGLMILVVFAVDETKKRWRKLKQFKGAFV